MHHIESPRTDDSAIEQEIKAKGLTAPRVTPADIEANIVSIYYVKHVSLGGQVLRWAVITTLSGFAVTGRPSVAVSPENDDAAIGEKVAKANALNELWSLMGYALKEQLYQAQQPAKAPIMPTPGPDGTVTYIGTKTVYACPMNRADYNLYRGWELPANEDGTDAGYLVEYADGGKANDSRHAGYISWWPKDVFERAYRAI